MKWIMVFLCLFLIKTAYAYELTGTMSDNNDKTYNITLQNETGLGYTGTGVMQGDGVLTITITAEDGETYLGTAKPIKDGTYELKLRNNASGDFATGTVEVD